MLYLVWWLMDWLVAGWLVGWLVDWIKGWVNRRLAIREFIYFTKNNSGIHNEHSFGGFKLVWQAGYKQSNQANVETISIVSTGESVGGPCLLFFVHYVVSSKKLIRPINIFLCASTLLTSTYNQCILKI